MSQDHSLAAVTLPKTSFPAHAAPETEAARVARWLAEGLHREAHAACAGRPRFVLHDGPPYANGDVHMGHALNKTLKDMVVRSQRMTGRDAVLVPGWDCHGLPVEWKVEEEFRAKGRQKRDVPVAEFRRACRDWAAAWVGRQMAGFQRLGVMADWDAPYLTMSPEADAATVGELHALLRAGRLYRALRPVLWSVPEQTVLAEAEVEYREEKFVSLMVRFPVAASPALPAGASLVCWTTTPWSLPGNRAVACAPGASYGVWRVGRVAEGSRLVPGEVLVMARDLGEGVLAAAGAEDWSLEAAVDGAALEGTVCRHPLRDLGYFHDVPVLAAGFVETGTGTGLVHVAPGLGPDDFRLGRERGLPVDETVGADGAYLASVPAFAGAAVVGADGRRGDADARVLDALEAAGAVVARRWDKHEAAHSWRSGAPLVYRATAQWFVSLDGLREQALSALADVAFLPEGGRARLASMLAARPDWCVSRQRSWGVPLGLFVEKATGRPLVDEEVLGRVRRAFAEEGSDAWFTRPAAWFLGPDRDPADWEKVDDVLDVWFESGCTHAWVVEGRWGAGAVADLYLEGSDQHRGWFQSSLLERVATRGGAPYRAVRTHGFLLDDKGRKMAKSGGNGVSPLAVADRAGADALRLWVAAADTTGDVRFSEAGMKGARETLRKFRNTLRWALGNLGTDPADPVPFRDLEEPERWMLGRLVSVDRELRRDVGAFDFAAMAGRLAAFCADDLSAFWFNMRKDSLYCDPASAPRRRGVAATLDAVFRCLARWLAPLAPFAAEEAWAARFGASAGSVHLEVWPELPAEWEDAALAERWAAVRAVRGLVMAAVEPEQQAGRVKALLEAEVAAPAPEALRRAVAGVDLAMVCGVAVVRMLAEGAPPEVRRAEGVKCPRCWQVHRHDHPDGTCPRCASA
jgi:isoleucyl-tRNA synthetase